MTAAAAGRGRGRPRDAGADVAILRAALDLFVDHGVEGTSIEQVARRAGVGKLTVYRRWAGKEELIAAAIESARPAEPAPDGPPDDRSLVEIVRAAVETSAGALVDPRFRALVARVLGTSRSHPSIMDTYWRSHVQPRREATRALLARARDSGALPADTDLDVLMDTMVGAVLYRLMQPDDLDAGGMRRYLETLYQQIGLLPR